MKKNVLKTKSSHENELEFKESKQHEENIDFVHTCSLRQRLLCFIASKGRGVLCTEITDRFGLGDYALHPDENRRNVISAYNLSKATIESLVHLLCGVEVVEVPVDIDEFGIIAGCIPEFPLAATIPDNEKTITCWQPTAYRTYDSFLKYMSKQLKPAEFKKISQEYADRRKKYMEKHADLAVSFTPCFLDNENEMILVERSQVEVTLALFAQEQIRCGMHINCVFAKDDEAVAVVCKRDRAEIIKLCKNPAERTDTSTKTVMLKIGKCK